MSGGPKVWDFFLCYARADQAAARELYALLRAHAEVFLDEGCLELGTSWMRGLVHALDRSRAVAVLFGPGWEHGHYNDDEVVRAVTAMRAGRATVLPVVLPGASASDLPYGLAALQSASGSPREVAPALLRWLTGQTQRAEPRRFVAGPPVEGPDFFGREAELDEIARFLAHGQPVQVVGERRMGKTSLLRAVEGWLSPGTPVARIDATDPAGSSPARFVRAAAAALGRSAEAERILAGGDDPLKATDATRVLDGATLLVDEADWLTRADTPFDPTFLLALRAMTQAKRLGWVSASKRNLRELLPAARVSEFLNDSGEVVVGELTAEAARTLLASGLDEGFDAALEVAARVPILLQRAGSLLQGGTDPELLADELADGARYELAEWWASRGRRERELLVRAAEKPVRGPKASGLARRGLLRRDGGGYRLVGEAWRGWVLDVD